jgi:N-acyl-phosphatidylethanolamine-hydrolysing phospholipase D
MKHKLFGGNKKVTEPSSQEDLALLEKELPMQKVELEHEYQKEIRYTWIGHSTAVIQVGQDNLLIDPVFSTRCSPSQWFGPKRYRRPACTIPELRKIDVVLVSHDHYDHLDEAALNDL